MKASETLRKAIERADISRYAIAQRTGVSESMLCRFVQGRPITTDTFDKLVDALGLELVPKTRGRTRKEGK
ncbi:MAG TPA: helix-turn-helix transcriptional regulator [Phycisphaerae bacterium]|jgi:transcriptional regulator with XRE-family HTH domain|nr:helix-turn-helix transcriptional regulator [Phycisphaerae bacterium]HPC23501.1 helix-turn-helix transcriptional regulator [Phycisphaerae bacterium]HRS29546.1 helix-turn-helix transcriptional regulator [Phycisphaerae bacterium]HRT42248.1 helix-turn-helix transcriptional regulator [Phycisphaerae bacterium]